MAKSGRQNAPSSRRTPPRDRIRPLRFPRTPSQPMPPRRPERPRPTAPGCDTRPDPRKLLVRLRRKS